MADFQGRTYFAADEFDAPESLSNHLVSLLDIARGHAGVPFRISSDFRAWSDGASAHEHGLAVDIDVPADAENYQRSRIVRGLLAAGFTRIGCYTSPHGGHVHADIADTVDPERWPPDRLWLGRSS